MTWSGAVLAGRFFERNGYFSGMAADIAGYVSDRDLWKFELPSSREINAWISSLPFDFVAWDDAAQLLASNKQLVREMGAALLAKTRQYASEVSKNVRLVEFHPFEGVPCVNVPQVDISEVLELLLDSFGTIALGWFVRADGLAQVSIRTRGDVDASELARRFGGGGHKNAAGFQVGLTRWAQVVLR
jgi:oligoribonuclease NrnB/cAMP/cGMP phosphodiesterase (DHH superfamily)